MRGTSLIEEPTAALADHDTASHPPHLPPCASGEVSILALDLPGSGTGVLQSRLTDPNRHVHVPRSEATLDVEWLLFTMLASDAKRAYSSTL